jgi:hypothetical protein
VEHGRAKMRMGGRTLDGRFQGDVGRPTVLMGLAGSARKNGARGGLCRT